MNYLTRLVGYSVLFLVVFLAVAFGAQAWLRQQTMRLRTEAIEAKRSQFVAAARAMAPADRRWKAADEVKLSAVVGGTVTLHAFGTTPPAPDTSLLYFDQPLEGRPEKITARVAFLASPMTRLLAIYQRVTVGILLFAFALVAVGVFFAALHWRGLPSDSDVSAPRGKAQAEIGNLTRLAQATMEQTAALTHERDYRRLAEENVQLSQKLLDQSLEGKVRLGHDLHDGIIQALYAAGLSIESARTTAKTNLPKADRMLAECVQNLNATIRDVRAYITGLTPEQLRRTDFNRAIEALVAELGAGREVKLDLKVDHEAAAALAADQTTESLQIAREAISNSLRHGGASFITVRLLQVDQEVCLLVQDNGTGFDPQKHGGSGFGLGNMQARAQRLGGSVKIESQPAGGTRVVVNLPLTRTIS
jgi:signal transduction histidine kinase